MSDPSPSPVAQRLVARYGPPEIGCNHWFTTIHALDAEDPDETGSPEETVVDLYWAIGNDAFFVSVLADPARPISASFTPTKGDFRGDFNVQVGGVALTGARVDRVLCALANWIRRGANLEHGCVIKLDDLPTPDSPS